LALGCSPQQILNEGLIAGMDVIGAKFKANEIFLPEVLVVARAMHVGLNILKPKLVETGARPVAKVLLGTVKADLHDIGKNLVGMMLQGAGFEVIDLGIDVPYAKFIDAIKNNNAQIVAMSALLSTTMPHMRATIEAIHKAGLANRVRILVGGAPVTQRYVDEIGASGFAPDAASAVDKARELVGAL
ncbi:MAG: corrinoid protein, partial [Candidatus Lindowbacteria bacterium]|nr:corrinoid protein [Candidatus Lindowbacteria bacterium]